jgi:hypothetical protein
MMIIIHAFGAKRKRQRRRANRASSARDSANHAARRGLQYERARLTLSWPARAEES